MDPLSNDDRFNLLNRYVSLEPTIKMNAERFEVSWIEGNSYLVFFAMSETHHSIDGLYVLEREMFDAANCGLVMASLYNNVLVGLEESIAQGTDKSDYLSVCIDL